jgi:hypothetical protein
MRKLAEDWSEQRRVIAQRVASVLYGVVAILTAELATQPGQLDYGEGALGALLVGLAMTVTRIFVEVVKKETEIGAHLGFSKSAALIGDSLLVMVFPVFTALMIVVGGLLKTRSGLLLDVIFYVSDVSVFIVGFVSSYILDRKLGLALVRGTVWLMLALVLLAAKSIW